MKIPWTEILFCMIVFFVGLLIPAAVAFGGIWEIGGFKAHAATHLALISQLLTPIMGIIYYALVRKKGGGAEVEG